MTLGLSIRQGHSVQENQYSRVEIAGFGQMIKHVIQVHHVFVHRDPARKLYIRQGNRIRHTCHLVHSLRECCPARTPGSHDSRVVVNAVKWRTQLQKWIRSRSVISYM